MTKQEYIEWALEDILTEVDDNAEIIASHLVASKIVFVQLQNK